MLCQQVQKPFVESISIQKTLSRKKSFSARNVCRRSGDSVSADRSTLSSCCNGSRCRRHRELFSLPWIQSTSICHPCSQGCITLTLRRGPHTPGDTGTSTRRSRQRWWNSRLLVQASLAYGAVVPAWEGVELKASYTLHLRSAIPLSFNNTGTRTMCTGS